MTNATQKAVEEILGHHTYINKRVREARIEGAEKVMEIIPPLGRNDCEKVYEWIAQLRKEEAE